MPKGKRARIIIDPADARRIEKGMDAWAEQGDLVGQRTRALVYLLWDGAVRTKVALQINAEEVVKNPSSSRISILQQVHLRPLELTRYQRGRFMMTQRARDAIGDYLRLVRKEGWLPGGELKGPLFLSSYYHGTGKRLSARTAIHSWQVFQEEFVRLSQEYNLEDLVYTGRKEFLRAAEGDSSALSDHAGITRQQAASYASDAEKGSVHDVITRIDGKKKRRVRS